MSAQPLEIRLAHMEGVNEQIVDRLNGVDRRLDFMGSQIGDLRSELNARFGQVDGRFAQMDQKFMWLIGINVTSWTTVMLAVLFRH